MFKNVRKNIISFTSTDELQYDKIEQKVKTLISKFDRHYNQDFKLSEEDTYTRNGIVMVQANDKLIKQKGTLWMIILII